MDKKLAMWRVRRDFQQGRRRVKRMWDCNSLGEVFFVGCCGELEEDNDFVVFTGFSNKSPGDLDITSIGGVEGPQVRFGMPETFWETRN